MPNQVVNAPGSRCPSRITKIKFRPRKNKLPWRAYEPLIVEAPCRRLKQCEVYLGRAWAVPYDAEKSVLDWLALHYERGTK